MQTSLDTLLTYSHPAVIRRFTKDFPAYAADAETIFADLLRFFWASKKHLSERSIPCAPENLDFIFIMDEEMKILDHMWHVFLLYTQDYMDFCNRYFGEYLHHLPDIVPTFQEQKFHYETNLSKFLSYVFDTLGEDVVRRWFPQSCAA